MKIEPGKICELLLSMSVVFIRGKKSFHIFKGTRVLILGKRFEVCSNLTGILILTGKHSGIVCEEFDYCLENQYEEVKP